MKKFYLTALLIVSAVLSFSAPITATNNNGNWKTNSTWDKNRKPQHGDTIVIPSGKTIIFNESLSLNNVYIKVAGTLRFSGLFISLSLNSSSKVIVQTGGKIESTIGFFFQALTVGGNDMFTSSNDIVGPQQATTAGFASFNPLPVKFVGFTATRKTTGDVLVQWSTSQEQNADRYEIERSYDGTNWNMAAYVAAVGNSSALNNYSFTDKGVASRTVYYRVKQVDLDGRSTYTSINIIRTETKGLDINIASVQNKVLLQFPKEVKGAVVVRFVSFSGQVVDQQTINNAVGQVVLNSKVSGNYMISVSNGQDLNVAKQVLL